MKKLVTKWHVLFIVLLACTFALSGLAGAADYKFPKALKIATPALGSNSYNLVLAWANKLEEGTGMKVRLLPENSVSAKWGNLKAKRFDLMQDTFGYIANWMIEGEGGFATKKTGPFPVRLFWQNQMMTFCLFVRGDSPVNTIYDIPKQGKDFRMVHWTVPGGLEVLQASLAWVGKTVDDVTLVKTNSYPGSVRMVAEGKADFAPFGIPPASVFIEAAAGPHGLKILDLDPVGDPEGARQFRRYMPSYTFPKNVAGPDEFKGKTGWGTQGGLICHADMDADLVYNIIKWSMDNFGELAPLHPFIKYFMNAGANKATFDKGYIPLHDGVIRYFKEKGQWTAANERRQEYNLKLQEMYMAAFKEALAEADKKKVKVSADNENWLKLWAGIKRDKGLPRLTVLTDDEIAAKLKKM